MRLATEADSQRIYDLRNQEQVREWSFNRGIIPYQDHEAWFDELLKDDSRKIYVWPDNYGNIVGVIRADIVGIKPMMGWAAELSFYVDQACCRKGIATEMLLQAEREIKKHDLRLTTYYAQTLGDNIASNALLKKSGYQISDNNEGKLLWYKFVSSYWRVIGDIPKPEREQIRRLAGLIKEERRVINASVGSIKHILRNINIEPADGLVEELLK